MKMPRPAGGGSFGIPADVTEAAERARSTARAERAKAESTSDAGAPGATAGIDFDADEQEGVGPTDGAGPTPIEDDWGDVKDKLPNDATAKKVDPLVLLKEIGVDLTEDDVHKLVFKGYLEKEVVVFKKPLFKATLKSLTAEEFDAVDELLAGELETVKMTREGVSTRRSMWVLSFGITHFQGRVLRDLQKEGAVTTAGVDLKKRAHLYREVLAKMSPYMIQELATVHSIYSNALSLIIRGNSPFLERA